MTHLVTTIASAEERTAFFEQPEVQQAVRDTRSILVQVFAGRSGRQWIFGVATAPQHGKVAGDILTAVDAALYRAKQNGRNRVESAGGGM